MPERIQVRYWGKKFEGNLDYFVAIGGGWMVVVGSGKDRRGYRDLVF